MLQELTAESFDSEVLQSGVPVLVDFWAPGCGPCRMLDPVLKEVAAEAGGRYRVGKVNAWEEPDLATRFSVGVVPTLLLFRGGAVVNTLAGYHSKRQLLEALSRVLSGSPLPTGRAGVPS